jgi:hypothetical protein
MKDRLFQFDKVLSRLTDLEVRGDYAKCKCPAHDDKQASLSLRIGRNDSLLLKCHAGCAVEDILKSIGCEFRDLYKQSGSYSAPVSKPVAKAKKKIVATYKYLDEDGKLLFETLRFEPKDFRQRRPDGSGGYVWNLQGIEPVLYRWNSVRNALAQKPDRLVFVVEGEKDVDLLEGYGLLAVSCPMGAGKWKDSYSEKLSSSNVVIVPDNDEAGRTHADQVKSSLESAGGHARILILPDLLDKQDVSDFVASYGIGRFKESVGSLISDKNETGLEPVRITLSAQEMTVAALAAVEDKICNIIDDEPRKGLGWEYTIENALGHCAASKWSGLYWMNSLRGGIDANARILVKVRKREEMDLVIRENDPRDAVYVFVTGDAPEFKVWGWYDGMDAGSGDVTVQKRRLNTDRQSFRQQVMG